MIPKYSQLANHESASVSFADVAAARDAAAAAAAAR